MRPIRSRPRPADASLALLILLSLAALPLGCGSRESRRASRAPIVVAQAESRSIPYEIEASGTVEAAASADVTAQVGGLVTALRFREGDEVAAGAALVQIDPRPLETSVAQAGALLARDRAQARTAQLELERAETLARQQLLASGELEDKRAAAEALAATVLADSANLARARLDLAYATVRAPISGRTGGLHVHVGDVVRPNDSATPIVTIHQLRPIRVRFSVPQADLPALRAEHGARVRVEVTTGPSDTAWTAGRLVFVDNQVDAATGTVLLKGEFANRDGALWPGAFVRVRMRLREDAGVVVVPAAAVGSSQNGPFCYVVKPDTTVELRPVQVARTWRGLSVIRAGLTPGEIVVTDGQVRLSPGARASIRTPGSGGPAGGARGGRAGRRP